MPVLRGVLARTGAVGMGVACSGVGTLAMLSFAAHASSVRTFATIAAWWVVASLVAFPFGVFEAFLTRLVVRDVAAGRDARAATSVVCRRALALAFLVALVLSALDAWLVSKYFDGVTGLGTMLGAYAVIGALQALQRGHAAGAGRFDVVSTQLVLDGALRALFVGLIVLIAPDHVRVVVGAICAGGAGSVALTHLRSREWLVLRSPRSIRVPWGPLVSLLVGAAGPVLINNASVPWLADQGARAAVIGAFSGTLTLSRVPIQLGGAVFGPLLNAIAHAVEAADHATVRRLSIRAVAGAGTLGALFTLAFTVLGPWVLELFIGRAYEVPRWVFLGLGASTGIMLLAIVTQARIAAQERWTAIAAAWTSAAVVFVLVLMLPGDIVVRAVLSPLCAVLAAQSALVVATLRPSHAARSAG